MFAIGIHAFPECVYEIVVRPRADAGFDIGCDIGGIEGAKRGLDGSASGQRDGVINVFGVAVDTAAGIDEVFALRDRCVLGRRRNRNQQ